MQIGRRRLLPRIWVFDENKEACKTQITQK
jgi:hypothetical protein